jgi:hypothetical protein
MSQELKSMLGTLCSLGSGGRLAEIYSKNPQKRVLSVTFGTKTADPSFLWFVA